MLFYMKFYFMQNLILVSNMINRHVYIKDTIYLYFDYNYEFGKFTIPKSNSSYLKIIKDYLKKIKFNGTKVVIMVGTIAVMMLSFNENKLFLDNIDKDVLYNDTSIVERITKNVIPLAKKKELKATENTNKDKATKSKKNTNITTSNKQTSKKTVNKNKNSNNTSKKENKKTEDLVTIKHNGKLEKINFDDYIIGVVAAEMPAAFNIEALKAQSVIARTYALNKINNRITLTDDNTTQNYIDTNQMKNKWGNSYDKYYNKIKKAVMETKNITVKYNGEYIEALYYSTSNGYSEDSVNVWGNNTPYLKSVESSWDKNVSGYLKTKTITLSEFNSKLDTDITNNSDIEIISRNNSKRVNKIRVGNKTYTGVEFRTLLGLRSADFDVSVKNEKVEITTRGYGHGVGMSQYGANEMAKKGYKYREILKHYYQGVNIG